MNVLLCYGVFFHGYFLQWYFFPCVIKTRDQPNGWKDISRTKSEIKNQKFFSNFICVAIAQTRIIEKYWKFASWHAFLASDVRKRVFDF